MKITKPFVVIATMMCMSLMYVAMAKPTEEKLKGRVDLLEVRVGELEAELARVSPDADLTGTTYCIFGQGSWLFAEEEVSAEVVFNPFHARVDITSPTEFTVTDVYDPITSIAFPSFTMVDDDDFSDPATGTYTVVGNVLTVDEQSFYMTPDAQVLVGGFFERSVDVGVDAWETGIIVGVRAASCD